MDILQYLCVFEICAQLTDLIFLFVWGKIMYPYLVAAPNLKNHQGMIGDITNGG
jgi:hypothetical protein